MENNAHKLQAILYAHGGEMKKSEIASLLEISLSEVSLYTQELSELLNNQGLQILETTTTLSLRSSQQYADFVTELQKSSDEKDIGAAGLEVLAIVLYKEGASRAVIDYVRGVNSSGTLRQLVLRGLLERTRDAQDARAWLYSATPELFAHLGISSNAQLPEFEALAVALEDQGETQSPEHQDE